MLAAAQREGVLRLHAEPEAVAEILFSLGDGFALRMLSRARARLHRHDQRRDHLRCAHCSTD